MRVIGLVVSMKIPFLILYFPFIGSVAKKGRTLVVFFFFTTANHNLMLQRLDWVGVFPALNLRSSY